LFKEPTCAKNRRNTGRKPKRKAHSTLNVWKPTGDRENNIFRMLLKLLTSPTFLIIVAIITVAIQIYFNLIYVWWVWMIVPSAIGLSVLIIIARRAIRARLLISKHNAKRYNNFHDEIAWHENFFREHVDLPVEQIQEDLISSMAFYRILGEALISLGLYEEVKRYKINPFTGKEYEYITPIEYHVDFILESGKGYILLKFSRLLISKIAKVDERHIYLELQNAGLNGWSVKKVDNYNTILFILKNEAISNAYDFSGVS